MTHNHRDYDEQEHLRWATITVIFVIKKATKRPFWPICFPIAFRESWCVECFLDDSRRSGLADFEPNRILQGETR